MSAPTQTCITCFNSFQGYAYKCNICLAQERQISAMKSDNQYDQMKNITQQALLQLKLQRMLREQADNDDDEYYVEPVRRAPRAPAPPPRPLTPEEIEADRVRNARWFEHVSEQHYYERAHDYINTTIRLITLFSFIASLVPLWYFHFMPLFIVGPIYFLLYIAGGSEDLATGICKLIRKHNDGKNKVYNTKYKDLV